MWHNRHILRRPTLTFLLSFCHCYSVYKTYKILRLNVLIARVPKSIYIISNVAKLSWQCHTLWKRNVYNVYIPELGPGFTSSVCLSVGRHFRFQHRVIYVNSPSKNCKIALLLVQVCDAGKGIVHPYILFQVCYVIGTCLACRPKTTRILLYKAGTDSSV